MAGNLSSWQRMARWKNIVLKLLMVFRVYEVQEKAKIVLGKDTYNKIFQQVKDNPAAQKQEIYRIVGEEIVGRQLPRGEGKEAEKATQQPALCQHANLVRRGNRTDKWWTCKDCVSRWERRSMKDVEPTSTSLQDTDLVTFGKHLGGTYLQVYQDQTYAQFILQAAEHDPKSLSWGSPDMVMRLARHIVQKEKTEGWQEVPTPKMDEGL